jgi:WD40 repeat protein
MRTKQVLLCVVLLSLCDPATWSQGPPASTQGALLPSQPHGGNAYQASPVRLSCRDECVYTVAFSPNSNLLVTRSKQVIRIWGIADQKELLTIKTAESKWQSAFSAAVFTPDGKAIASSCGDCPLGLWDAVTGKPLFRLGAEEVMNNAAISQDVKRVAIENSKGVVKIWDVATGKRLLPAPTVPEVRIDEYPGPISTLPGRLTFSPDNTALAVGGSNVIQVRRVHDGKTICQLECYGWPLCCGSFSNDGQLLATGGEKYDFRGRDRDTPVNLWSAETGKLLQTLKGHQRGVYTLTFAPDRKTIASGGPDGTVRLWEVATGQELIRLRDKDQTVYSVAFSPDGKRLAAGLDEGVALVWDLPISPPNTLPKPLTEDQFRRQWEDLTADNGTVAYRAVSTLCQAPNQTTAFLKAHLKPVVQETPTRITQLIADLGSSQFAAREQASQELARLGMQAEAQLRKAMKETTSAEVQMRIRPLLAKLNELKEFVVRDRETLRRIRAVWVLQLLGTPEARAHLEELARGAAADRLTQEAQAALAFLNLSSRKS